MRVTEIEEWALRVIRSIESGQPHEDVRVELKESFQDARKTARQIAGHANAARGQPILWVIGVSERQGVTGAKREDLARWWDQVRSEFDGVAPRLIDVNVPIADQTVVALLFEPEQPPYVVRNPAFIAAGDPDRVKYEVPWREGTQTRTATHSDLVLLLVPLSHVPHVELLSGELVCSLPSRDQKTEWSWRLSLQIYVTPETRSRVVIPFHRSAVEFKVSDLMPQFAAMSDIKLKPDMPKFFTRVEFGGPPPPRPEPLSRTIDATDDEAIIDGPGKLNLSAVASTPAFDGDVEGEALAVISLRLAGRNAESIRLPVELRHTETKGEKITWSADRELADSR